MICRAKWGTGYDPRTTVMIKDVPVSLEVNSPTNDIRTNCRARS